MKVKITPVTSWERVANAARLTVHKDAIGHEPSEKFIRDILKSRHSPIRLREYDILIEDVPYWVMVHLVRHKIGVEFFVGTSRDDRNDNQVPRAEMPQGSLITMQVSINAEALIQMASMRLCGMASKETRDLLRLIKAEMWLVDKPMADAMVPRCIRLGACPEHKPCGRFDKQKHNELYGI